VAFDAAGALAAITRLDERVTVQAAQAYMAYHTTVRARRGG
jgi:hypothetical protein